MKRPNINGSSFRHPLNVLATIVLGLAMAGSHRASAQIQWSGASGAGNKWSTAGNWSGGAVPGAADAVRFAEDGTDATQGNVNNTLDSLFGGTVLSLQYAQTNLQYHTTLIEPGKTLTILDDFIVGSETAQPSLTVTILGAGAAVMVTNPAADFVVRQGGNSVSSRATLDMSGLDTFIADVNRVIIGRADPSGYPNVNRNTGWLYLAKTNRIRAAVATTSNGATAIEVGRSGSNNGSGSRLYLGQTNALMASSLSVGMEKETACQMLFNTLFTDSIVFIRGADGSSRMSLVAIGDGESNSGTTGCQGTADFTGGTVDALADTMTVGRASSNTSGTGNSRGTLTMERGLIDVNTLQVGLQTASTGKNGDGTVNVNGGTLQVNTLLELGHGTGGAGLATTVGRLNINGGTVIAPQIVCGIAGSQITLAGSGRLVTSNKVGTVAAPVGTLSLTDATLPVELQGASAPLVVSNLVTGGVQNRVNVTALPTISQYPATLPVISYLGGFVQGSGNNFVLGTLPAANPAFQGSLVDDGTSISLRLTSGPVTDLRAIWTGATDANWDTTTANWINKGVASVFVPGGEAYFLDTAARADVNLVGALAPSSITVSNTSLNYRFSGTGGIAEAGRLLKEGSGSFVIANEGANNFNVVNVNAGTLQVGDGGTNGTLTAASVTNNAGLVVNRAGTVTLSAPISGTGSLTKSGSGQLNLSAESPYTGATLLGGGTLAVNNNLTGGGQLTGAAGTTLTGSGFYVGPVQSAGVINPGGVDSFGRLRLGGNLVLPAGGTLAFDLSGDTAAYDPAVNDALEVTGMLTLNNTSIRVNLQGLPQPGVPYTILSYSGITSGSFNPTVAGTHFQAALDTSLPGQATVTFNNTTGLDLKWASKTSGRWNADETNWVSLANGQPAAFYAGDTALFDDTAEVATNVVIGAGVTVTAAGITNRSDANQFTIGGAGRISGPTGIHKEGASTLAINTANNFTGPVVVRGGTLRTGTATALGTTAAGTTISPGATLDLNGQNLGQEPVTVGGPGVGGQGAIVNNGPDQTQALRTVTLTGDAVFGGTARWDIRNGTVTTDGTVATPVKITKVGTNQFSFVATTIPALLGEVDIQEGIFAIQTTTAQLSLTANGLAFGDPARTITIRTNATLNLWALGVDYPLDKPLALHGGGTLWNDSGTCVLSGSVTLLGPALVNVDDTTILNINNTIGGAGGLTKARNGLLNLSGANTYSGDTLINGGTVALIGTASISATRSIAIAAGAKLDASARTDARLTLASPQRLTGSGTVAADLAAGAGTTVAPGSPLGTLTVAGNATLGGTCVLAISSGSTPNCGTLAATNITLGGVLIVTNAGPALAGGESFHLFNTKGGAYLGSFSSVELPALQPGLSWDTSQLAATGTLRVNGTAISPSVSGIALVDDSIVVRGTGGAGGGTYYVLTSTSVAAPLAGWTPVSTNVFLSNGDFIFTNAWEAGTPQRFYRIQVP